MPLELDLLRADRATVTAPAGCGKTQLIADSLNLCGDERPTLVLTHTNSGVAALKARLQKADVSAERYVVLTIDGFALRLSSSFPMRGQIDANALALADPRNDYPAVRAAAHRIISQRHLDGILLANYGRLLVDEYQDCNLTQHAIVDSLANLVPTCVLGDPMQAIFDFAGAVVDWQAHVLDRFPPLGELGTPWRWNNARREALGAWVLEARRNLLDGGSIDLRQAPPDVQWIDLSAGDPNTLRRQAAMTRTPVANGTVLIIGDSMRADGRHQIASVTPGATTVEPVDLRDLTAFAARFDPGQPNACSVLANFASGLMTNVGAAQIPARIESLRHGRARNPATEAEQALVDMVGDRAIERAGAALYAFGEQQGTRIYRPQLLRSAISALRTAASGRRTLAEAAMDEREKYRHVGRTPSARSVGSTLLLKGLEADVAVILHPERMNARHLYVALSRGASQLVVCSDNPILTPAPR
jgi:DNA helicase-2/ATP-dependent DNA helicase PcrA